MEDEKPSVDDLSIRSTDKTSAVETLKDWGNVLSKDEFDALLDRVIDAPTDADGNVLHVGDEVTSWVFDGSKRVGNFRLFLGTKWEACVGGGASWPCPVLHRVMPDSRERKDIWDSLGSFLQGGRMTRMTPYDIACARLSEAWSDFITELAKAYRVDKLCDWVERWFS